MLATKRNFLVGMLLCSCLLVYFAPTLLPSSEEDEIPTHFIPEWEAGEMPKQVSPKEYGPISFDISLDRQVYRPGDEVNIRLVAVDTLTLQPIPYFNCKNGELENADGSRIPLSRCIDSRMGVSSYKLKLDPKQPGGEYKIHFGPKSRTFTVYVGRRTNPKLSMHLDEDGVLTQVTRLSTGEFAVNASVEARLVSIATGEVIWEDKANAVNENGECFIGTHQAPEDEETMLNVLVRDGSRIETISRVVPPKIIVPTEFYAESGFLLEGSGLNRVFADKRGAKGQIVNKRTGRILGNLEDRILVHRGETNDLVLRVSPKLEVDLNLKSADTLITSDKVVFDADEDIDFILVGQGPLTVGLYKNGVEMQTIPTTVANGQKSLTFRAEKFSKNYHGVLHITAFAADSTTPLAEKLVFRKPLQDLRIELDGPETSSPGSTVELTVRAYLGDREVDDAILSLSVVDVALDQDVLPDFPTRMMLEDQVLELEHYDRGDMEWLLSTQDWRRFLKCDERKEEKDERIQRLCGYYESAPRLIHRNGIPMELFRLDAVPLMANPRPEFALMKAFKHDVQMDEMEVMETDKPQESVPPRTRRDFKETVYWNPLLKSGDKVSFKLSDSVTTYKVLMDGITVNGVLGTASTSIVARKSTELDVVVGEYLVQGDELQVAVTVETNRPSIELTLKANDEFEWKQTVKPGRVYIAVPEDTTKIRLECQDDAIERTWELLPKGFPREISFAGTANSTWHVHVPRRGLIPGTLQVNVRAYTSVAGNLVDSVKALLRRPCGCFEQTSSTTYPLLLVLEYLFGQERTDTIQAMIEDAIEKLREGYKRLISFESEGGGFEWFGGSPGHETLTAYGLLQFAKMRRLIPGLVDNAMLDRTRTWLMGRRDDKGFKQSAQALDSFGRASPLTSDAYIIWSLANAQMLDGSDDLVKSLLERVEANENPYLCALTCAILSDDDPRRKRLAAKLVTYQSESGLIDGNFETITMSMGSARIIEATALAVLAWVGQVEYLTHTQDAVNALLAQAKNGMFGGSTQATALTLQAIVAFENFFANLGDANESPEFNFPFTKHVGYLQFDMSSVQDRLAHQTNDVDIAIEAGAPYPIVGTISYRSDYPESSPLAPARIETSLSAYEIKEGHSVNLHLELTAVEEKPLHMVVAVVGLPACLSPNLKSLRNNRDIAYFEVVPGFLRLYWREFKSSSTSIQLDSFLVGRFTSMPTHVYQYYNAEHVFWTNGYTVQVHE